MASLDEMDVLVVDCQATGASPAHGSLLELGWTIVRAGGRVDEVTAHTIALPAGERIPRIVRELTGIDPRNEHALSPEEAWRRLLAKAAGVQRTQRGAVPTVIHFARFELAFLRDLHARIAPEVPFPFEVACAHEIARRLYPSLPRRGLRALAGYLGHGLHLERRSRGHVEATAFVWRRITPELSARALSGWEELLDWLASTSAPPSSKRRTYPMPRETRLALPDAPGVYRFSRSNGDVLYVGKATSLKKRVASHLTRGARADERALEMLTQAQRIDTTVTATALEAALLEADEIKRLDPPYNVQLRDQDASAWFASRDLARASPKPDDAHPIGPLPSRHALSGYAAVRALLSGEPFTRELCARAVSVPTASAPTADELAAGLASFVAEHVCRVRSRTPSGALQKVSKSLWRLAAEGALDEGERDADPARGWDPDRVRRHLERSVLSGGQLQRRARWLCLLSDSVVAFREEGAARRALVIERGEIVERRDLEEPESTRADATTGRSIGTAELVREAFRARTARRPWRERQACFDRGTYDRLRVLATELKRVLVETGDLAVAIAPDVVLDGLHLRKMLEGA